MALSHRGKTTPASNAGSYAPYAHGAPDLDLHDGTDPFSDGFGGHAESGTPTGPTPTPRTMPRTTGGSKAPSTSHAVVSINQAMSEWNQAFPDRLIAHNQEALMARALEVEQALEAGMPIPAPSWGEPRGPARGASAQAFVDAMRAGREAGLSETGAMAGLLRDQTNAEPAPAPRPARVGRWSQRQVKVLKVGAKVQHAPSIGMHPATPGSDADPHYEITGIRPNGLAEYAITLEARNGAPEAFAGTRTYQGWMEFKAFEPTKVTSIPDGSPATRVAALRGKPYETWISEDQNNRYIADDGAYAWVHPEEGDSGRWFIDGEHADGTPVDGFADSSSAAIKQASALLRDHR